MKGMRHSPPSDLLLGQIWTHTPLLNTHTSLFVSFLPGIAWKDRGQSVFFPPGAQFPAFRAHQTFSEYWGEAVPPPQNNSFPCLSPNVYPPRTVDKRSHDNWEIILNKKNMNKYESEEERVCLTHDWSVSTATSKCSINCMDIKNMDHAFHPFYLWGLLEMAYKTWEPGQCSLGDP